MKALVAVKRVIDYKVKIRVKPDESGVITDNVKMSMNPFDEIAVEEAVRLKEKGVISEIVCITIGEKKCEDILRSAFAMGADKAIHVKTDDELRPLHVAKVLKGVFESEKPDLVIMGKQAIDDDSNQTGQMLAALLDLPQLTYASEVNVNGSSIEVTREVDGGLRTESANLPAIVTTDLRLNEPRFVKLPDIMKARSKPIDEKSLEDFGVSSASKLETVKVTAPKERSGGIKVADAAELVNKLKEAGAL